VPINVSPNPEKSVLPITNMRERQAVELREKRQLVGKHQHAIITGSSPVEQFT
jgi:hypothetical protein